MNIYSLYGEVTKMPNFDQTGPEGKGPLTGKSLGKCEGAQSRSRGFCRGRRFQRN